MNQSDRSVFPAKCAAFTIAVRHAAEASDEELSRIIREHFAPDLEAMKDGLRLAFGEGVARDIDRRAGMAADEVVARMRDLSRNSAPDDTFTVPRLVTISW